MNGGDDSLAGLARAAEAGDDDAVERELSRLLALEAAPVLTRAVRAQLPDLPAEEREEIEGDAMLRLATLLRRFAAGDESIRIESFRAYAATTAVNGCRAWLRARSPERTRLQNALRYVLRNDRTFAAREEADGTLRHGLANWGESGGRRTAADDDDARDDPRTGFDFRPDADRKDLPALLRRFFLWRGRTLTFTELTAAIAEGLGVRDLPTLAIVAPAGYEDDDADTVREPADDDPGAARVLEDREFLERLWVEVRELPHGQRVALLLNLRDPQGRDRLRLFPVTGVATLRDLARSLEMPPGELEALLPALPLEDRVIADRLRLTPRQVINLRKSARARLARRLAAHLGGGR